MKFDFKAYFLWFFRYKNKLLSGNSPNNVVIIDANNPFNVIIKKLSVIADDQVRHSILLSSNFILTYFFITFLI